MAPFSMTLNVDNQDFKVTPISFDAECDLRNGTRYRHSYSGIL